MLSLLSLLFPGWSIIPQLLGKHRSQRASLSSITRRRSREDLAHSQLHHPFQVQVLPELIAADLITPIPLKTAPNPSSKSYDPNARCAYHMGGVGHWTDHCSPLKYKIQNLIEDLDQLGLLKFENKSNLIQNSLPTHGNNNNAGPSTNEISNKKRLKPSQLITPSGIYRLSFDDEEDLPGVAVIYPNLTPPEGKTADSMEEASANDTMFQQVASSIEQMKGRNNAPLENPDQNSLCSQQDQSIKPSRQDKGSPPAYLL